MPDPQKTGLVHIVGIGGIGMSAIAEVMYTRGYTVQGSDLKDSANLERLRARNIRCLIGHDPANLDGASTLVISSAVKAGNPEFEAAKERGIPIIRRAEMLAELMRPCATVSITGTHGKTTTTSLIADLLKGGGLDPTVIAGGIINDWGTNARIGKGEWMVVEADESDGTSSNSSKPFPITGSWLPASIIPWCASFSPSSAARRMGGARSLMAWRAMPISGSPISGRRGTGSCSTRGSAQASPVARACSRI